jgi:two-component system CheB/CheR fusion protein
MPSALVIEDNRQLADSLCQMLELLGVKARPAYGPRAAILSLNESQPSVIFTDINLPGVDGFEIIAYLRRLPQLAEVPIVIVTSDDQPETAQRARQIGAKEIIIKPVSLEVLEKVLADLKLP